MNSVTRFFSEVKSELKKVTWPTRDETIRMTVIVIITTVIVGSYVGLIDYSLTKALELLIQ